MCFLALPAPDGKRERTQPCLRDLAAALGTVAIRALSEPIESDVDLAERFRRHLDQRQVDVFADVSLEHLILAGHVALVPVLGTNVAHLPGHAHPQLVPPFLEHLSQLRVPPLLRCLAPGCHDRSYAFMHYGFVSPGFFIREGLRNRHFRSSATADEA